MTKQEVQENIRYNENLVYQYQRDLNNLNSRLNSLNSRSNQLNGQISSLRLRKQTLEREVGELQRLKSKIQGLRDDFSSRQSKRVNNFNHSITQILSVRFITSYISGMRDLLSGQEYRNTYNGISTAYDRVSDKLQTKQRELESTIGQYNSAQNNIDSTRRDINSCRNQISQKNSDLSYRRRRIQYWEEQLQYAT